jgi:deazaflavin-dependent oxidoreductase (nitroreductase family)
MSTTSQAARKNQAAGVGKSLQRLFMKGHVSLYRLTGGKVGGGEHLLILTTTGRKSGVERDTPLFFFHDGDQFIIIASAGGAPKHPTWWLNLKSNPQAKIQTGSQVISVTAKEAEGEERARLWAIIADNYKNFVQYQTRTSRELPVIILTPTV